MTIKKLKSIDIINVLSDLVSEKLETTVKLPCIIIVDEIIHMEAITMYNVFITVYIITIITGTILCMVY